VGVLIDTLKICYTTKDILYLSGRGADLHVAQLIPLPLTVSCSRKSKLVLVLHFWYRLNRVVPDKIQKAVNDCNSSSNNSSNVIDDLTATKDIRTVLTVAIISHALGLP